MPIAEIISEIDAYLLCLRHARDLLSAPMTRVRRTKAPRGKKKVNVTKTAPAVSSRPRIPEKKSRSNSLVRRGKKVEEHVDFVPQLLSSVSHQVAEPEQPPIMAVALEVPPVIETEVFTSIQERLPIQSRPHQSTPRRAAPRTFAPKLENLKPTTALTGSMSSRIVVVSAEDAKRERERAAQPEVRPRRMPSSGLTGRLAFEALFKDE